MNEAGGGGGGLALRSARWLARRLVPESIWPAVQEELEEELRSRSRSPLVRELWGAWQYATIGVRVWADGLPSFERPSTDGVGDDLRQAWRRLRRRPLTAVSIVATVALAVGATTSVYSVVDGVLLRPLPYPESEELARVWQTSTAWGKRTEAEFRSPDARMSPLAPSYYDWLQADVGFQSLGAYVDAAFVLQDADRATALRGQEATSGLFDALRVEPQLGRALMPRDDVEGAPPVVVLSHSLWRDHFDESPAIVGTALRLDGVPHTVVGVMPEGFTPPPVGFVDRSLPGDRPLLWTPLTAEARRGWKSVSVLGRLSEGVSHRTASERLAVVQDGLTAVYADYRGAWSESLLTSVVGDVRSTLWFLMAVVGLVLVVATVNIANILTTLGLSRRHELAVRASLGAGASRLARGLLLESALLAALGGVGGILLTLWGLPVMTRYVPPSLPRRAMIELNSGVLAFGIGVTACVAVTMGVLPAILASRSNPQEAMRQSSRSQTGGRSVRRVRAALVVTQVSLAFVLLISAALLARSYDRLWSVERGFATTGLMAVWVALDRDHVRTEVEADAFVEELAVSLESLPGVRATAANNLPLSGMRSGTTFYVDRPDGSREVMERGILTVALDNYFDVLGIRVVEGRAFSRTDTRDAPPVAIVSRTMAEQAWPGESALGRRLRTFDDSTASLQVVGVAEDVRHSGLASSVDPTVYLPASQSRRDTNETILRVSGDARDVVGSVRAAVTRLSPTTPIRRVMVLDQAVSDSVSIPRFRTILVLALAGLAAALSLLGVYGVVSHAVVQESREIGIRMALGARSNDEVRRVVRGGLRLGLLGTALGSVLSWAMSDVLGTFLFETGATDLATYVAAFLVVSSSSALAAWVPARRAASIEPVSVLQGD